ncbi:MAG: HD domain-containing protein [Ruminococcus sp.]|nr:HD domain-containing protein [Ruminococcus sp.]
MTKLNMTVIPESVAYVLEYFKRKNEIEYCEVINAFNLYEEISYAGKDEDKRYYQAYVMCRYMKPDSEDLVSLLFAPAVTHGIGLYDKFRSTFSKETFKKFYNHTSECAEVAYSEEFPNDNAKSDYNTMIHVCDKRIEHIIDTMEAKYVPDSECVMVAYRFAKEAHKGVLRQSGEPYLNHPVSVAEILAEVGVESSVIAAAVLHDVMEDSEYQYKDISLKCGEQVAKLVDAVTEVNKQFANSYKRNEYSSDKKEMDAKSFEKLVRAVESDKRMIFALYIKAADRIHNLSTIDVMSGIKKHNKTDETEYQYLPLFKRFGLTYFVRIINDLTWRTVNPQKHLHFSEKYHYLFEQNRPYIEEFKKTLDFKLKVEANALCETFLNLQGFEYHIEIKQYLPQEVYAFVRNAKGNDNIYSHMIGKDIMPICDFDIILTNEDKRATIENFATIFIKMFFQHLSPEGVVITDYSIDSFHRFIVSVKTKYSNTIRLCFALRKDYLCYYFGNSKDSPIDKGPSPSYIDEPVINIKLRNGKRRTLPKGATVLDAAFSIHPDIGMTAKAAKINGVEASIYSMLHDGDKVEIIADTERVNGVRTKYTTHVRIGWLEYVVTKEAKHQIVKTLENRYGDADPADTHKAQDEVVAKISGAFTEELKNS